MIETMIEIKFGWEVLTIVPPASAIIGWSLFISVVSVWAAWKFTYPLKEFPVIKLMFKQKKKAN